MAERGLTLPDDGEVEADALVAWLAGLGALAGVGLAAGALVLLAATTSAGTTVAGLAAERGAGGRPGRARAPAHRSGRWPGRVDGRETSPLFAGGFVGALARLLLLRG